MDMGNWGGMNKNIFKIVEWVDIGNVHIVFGLAKIDGIKSN
jgi:hypothetical protein